MLPPAALLIVHVGAVSPIFRGQQPANTSQDSFIHFPLQSPGPVRSAAQAGVESLKTYSVCRRGVALPVLQVTAECVSCDTALDEGPSTIPCMKAYDGCMLFTFHPVPSAPQSPARASRQGWDHLHPGRWDSPGASGQTLAQGDSSGGPSPRSSQAHSAGMTPASLLLGGPAAPGPCPKTLSG